MGFNPPEYSSSQRGVGAVSVLLNDFRARWIIRCEWVKDTLISIRISHNQGWTCWWVWPRAEWLQWFPSFLKESSVGRRKGRVRRETFCIVRPLLIDIRGMFCFSSLYFWGNVGQITSTWNSMNKILPHTFLLNWETTYILWNENYSLFVISYKQCVG